ARRGHPGALRLGRDLISHRRRDAPPPSRIAAVYGSSPVVAVQDDYFERDNVGRVTEILDAASAQDETQCFVYDGHNRLSSAWTIETASVTPGSCMVLSDPEDP